MKKELRDKYRQLLGDMSLAEFEHKSNLAAGRLFRCPEFAKAQVIMAFVSLPTEIDTTPVIMHAWQERKRVCVPKVSWEQRRMMPVEINSLTEDLAETQFGLHEPISGVPVPLTTIDLVIVPGLAFDEFGNRLGRGRGFYDRFLANGHFDGKACAFAFDEQVTTGVPVGPHDRAVNMIVTDERTIRVSQ